MELKQRYFAMGIVIINCMLMMLAACRQEDSPPPPKVEKIEFQVSNVSLDIDEIASIKIDVSPSEAKKKSKVEYTTSTEGIIAISDTSNDGCVIKGIGGGSVVMMAKADGVTAYLEVTVSGQPFIAYPYIVIPTQVIEVLEGQQRSLQVSLFNGTLTDNNLFEWSIEEGKENISILSTANTVVVKGEQRGTQKIIVSHERAEYNGEILVFVTGVEETPRYITTPQNVILMEVGGVNRQFNAMLVNGLETDNNAFAFNVIEGQETVTIVSSNEVCNVVAEKTGTAVIRVTHPLAEYPLDVRIIAVNGREPVIEIDKSLILMNVNDTDVVNMTIDGNAQSGWVNDCTFMLSDTGIINVTQLNNTLFIEGIQPGSCVIDVTNDHIRYGRQILVIVQSGRMVPPDEYYITTSQNIMQLEMGQTFPSTLMMQLAGGNEADKDSFEWTVEDGAIVDVDSAHGKVNYNKRAMRSQITSIFNAIAIVTPKKIGQTKIVVTHPKTDIAGVVIVRVYPKGTFATAPIVLGLESINGISTDQSREGIIKVDTTQADTEVKMKAIVGNALDAVPLSWRIENGQTAQVTGGTALVNTIKGLQRGYTKLIIESDNLRNPYEGLVMVGTTAELAAMNIIYADNVYQEMAVRQSISVEIKDSNNSLTNSPNFTVTVDRPDLVYAVMVRNCLLLQGLGETNERINVTVSNTDALNDLSLYVMVMPESVSIDKPYIINGPNFVGMIYKQEIESSVSMAGASEAELDKTEWKAAAANNVITVNGNGAKAKIKAGNITGQTNVTVTNPRANNEKTIVYYVVEKEEDLNKIVLGIEKEHHLMKTGDSYIARLITNASPEQKSGLLWDDYDLGVVRVDANGDSAMIRAVGTGTTSITVTHRDDVNGSVVVKPLKIHISVSDMDYGDKVINVPSIVEIIIGESKQITASVAGMSADELRGISWTVDNSGVVTVSGNGEWAYVTGKGKGYTAITVKQPAIQFEKRIAIVCAETYEDLLNMVIMAAPQTYYRIKPGEQKNLELEFGSAGFPEEEKPNIKWTVTQNNTVAIFPNNAKIMFEGRNAGSAELRAEHELVKEFPVIIKIDVEDDTKPTGYRFNFEPMKGLVIGDLPEKIAVSIVPSGASYNMVKYGGELPTATAGKVNVQGIAEIDKLGNGYEYELAGKSKGKTYVYFSHDLVNEPARVLVYTADTREELDGMWPLSVVKSNYLISIGESVIIKVNTPTEEENKINQISWSLNDNRIVDYEVLNKREVKVTGASVGSCIFDIKYAGVTQEKVYVSVKNNAQGDSTVKITTESIIGLENGKSRQTALVSNLSNDEITELEWTSGNGSIASVQPLAGDRSKAVITAHAAGETEIVVTYRQLKRHIKVYVQDDEESVSNYKAVNIDNRYYLIRRNDELTLTGFHAMSNAASDDVWEDVYGNNVVTITEIGKNKAQIRGINEGIAAIRLSNSECSTPVMIMVEVSNTAPSVEAEKDVWYLSAAKTLYAIDNEQTTATTLLEVIPMRFDEAEIGNITWRIVSGANLITLYPRNGKTCEVAPNGGKGTAVVRVNHNRSSNYLDLTVICGLDLVADDITVPFITTDIDTVRIGLNGTREVRVHLHNVPGADLTAFSVKTDNGNAEAGITGDLLTIRGIKSGQTLVTVEHKASNARSCGIVVIVAANESGIIYVTTRDNFIVLQQNDFKTASVELVGFEDIDNNLYNWKDVTFEGEEAGGKEPYVRVDFSGRNAVITGLRTGTARIKVVHKYAEDYPLYIYARVTQQIITNPVYITTSNNIVSMRKGGSMNMQVELKNGMQHELSQFVWELDNLRIAELTYSGDQALIKANDAGTTAVTVIHPSSMNRLVIMVIIEPELTENGIYITTDDLLVEMRRVDSPRQIRARLVGGNAEDIYGFRWEIVDYNSIEKMAGGQSREVISIIGNADTCVVSPKSEGYAVIRVTHPKTSYRLEMRVVVQDTAVISFGRNNITLNQAMSESIIMSAPTGETVVYYSSNERVAVAAGTSRLCIIEAIGPGTAIITAQNPQGTKSDEIIVVVNRVDNTRFEYIEVSQNLLFLKTSSAAPVITARLKDSTTGAVHPDGAYIRWNAQTSGVVRFSPASQGEQVSIVPLAVGETEIQLTLVKPNNVTQAIWDERHPTMKQYIKRIFVKVENELVTFIVNNNEQYIGLTLGDSYKDIYATVGLPDLAYFNETTGARAVEWGLKLATNSEGTILQSGTIWQNRNNGIVAIEDMTKAKDAKATLRILPRGKGDTEIYCRYQDMEFTMLVQVRPVNSITVSESVITVLPNLHPRYSAAWNALVKEVIVNIYPPGDGWGTRLSTNSFCEIVSGISGTDGGKIIISGKDVEGQTEIYITGVANKVETVLKVVTNKNYFVNFGETGMIRKKITTKTGSNANINTDPHGSRFTKTGADAIGISYTISPSTEVLEIIPASMPGHVNVEIDGGSMEPNRQRTLTFWPKKAGSGIVEFKGRDTGLITSIPVYYYHDNINPEWIEAGRDRGEQAVNNGYPSNMSLLSKFDSIRGAVIVADGELIEVSVNKYLIDTDYYMNDFRILQHTAKKFEEMNDDLRGKVRVRMGNQNDVDGSTENTIQIEFNNGRINGNSPSNLLLGVEFVGTLKIGYAYSNGGTRPAEFERVFLIYAEKYKRP